MVIVVVLVVFGDVQLLYLNSLCHYHRKLRLICLTPGWYGSEKPAFDDCNCSFLAALATLSAVDILPPALALRPQFILVVFATLPLVILVVETVLLVIQSQTITINYF